MRQHPTTALCVMSFLSFSAGTAMAQIGAAQCVDRSLTGPFTAWAEAPADAETATGAGDVADHTVPMNTRTHLKLQHRDHVEFLAPPEEPNMPADYVYSGMVSFTVPIAGTYRIASVEGMWLDVVQNGALVTSTAFGRGPECMGKRVDFPLEAGDAVLQLSGGPYEVVDILIAKVP